MDNCERVVKRMFASLNLIGFSFSLYNTYRASPICQPIICPFIVVCGKLIRKFGNNIINEQKIAN
jgi:hypothetical protein